MTRTSTLIIVLAFSTSPLVAEDRFQERELLSYEQSWSILDTGGAAPAGWTRTDFDDSGWAQTDGIASSLPDPDSLRVGVPAYALRPGVDTAYFRTTFTLDKLPEGQKQLVMDLVAKDGAVFYLNGREIGRTATMAEGPVEHGTRALRSPRPRVKAGFGVDPSLLRVGQNVLALSLHGFTDEENPASRALAVEMTLFENMDLRPATGEPRHLRVTWLENPQSEAVISWTTGLEGEQHHLYYDTESRRGRTAAYAKRATASHAGRVTLTRTDLKHGSAPAFFTHVHLAGLEPDTMYYFVAETDGERSGEFHFRTAPADDRPIKILFGGDSRIGGDEPYFHHDRRSINRRMAALAEEHSEVIAFLHGGDFAQLAQWRYLEPWLTDHELARTQDGRIIPLIPIRGNHDRDVGFEEIFWWPEQDGDYYFETKLTPRVTLIALNSEISLGGQQQQWLKETLAEARPESRWLVTAYHKPAWPSVRGFEDGANRRRFWVPYFEANRVDLSFESHDHALKRTVPILDNAEHPDGVVYIGDGGLGVPQRNPDSSRWYLQGEGIARPVHHVHVISFDEETLQGVAYNLGGESIDEFVRPLRKGVAYSESQTDSVLAGAARD